MRFVFSHPLFFLLAPIFLQEAQEIATTDESINQSTTRFITGATCGRQWELETAIRQQISAEEILHSWNKGELWGLNKYYFVVRQGSQITK